VTPTAKTFHLTYAMPIEMATPSEMERVTAIPMPMQTIGSSNSICPQHCKGRCFGSQGLLAGKDNGENGWVPAVQPSSPQQQSLQLINHFYSAVDPTVQASSAGFSVNSDKKENGYISSANVFGGAFLGSAMTAF
jgi:hypothetical protein